VTDTVPSPTFTLVQSYDAGALPVSHFDLYRLKSPAELDELGWDELLDSGAALVEWPERAGARLPPGTLHVRLELADGSRRARLEDEA
jgi:tRNA threonylcarbamoyl adenosine modification protein YjeE